MPQPISTPTAAGIIAPRVGITLPTVAPIPQCTSGIAATHLKTNGSMATLRNCFSAASSTGTPLVQALIGTPFSLVITLYMFSDIFLLLVSSTTGSYHTNCLPCSGGPPRRPTTAPDSPA